MCYSRTQGSNRAYTLFTEVFFLPHHFWTCSHLFHILVTHDFTCRSCDINLILPHHLCHPPILLPLTVGKLYMLCCLGFVALMRQWLRRVCACLHGCAWGFDCYWLMQIVIFAYLPMIPTMMLIKGLILLIIWWLIVCWWVGLHPVYGSKLVSSSTRFMAFCCYPCLCFSLA